MEKRITAHDLTFEPLIKQQEIKDKIAAIGQQITKDYEGKRPLFLCILNGSFIFAADLVRACELECEISFLRFSSYEGTQSTGQVSTVFGLDTAVKDRHIIVVEDIVDSGQTLQHFMFSLKDLNPASIALAVLLLKPDALKFELKIDYLGFEISNKFVVGYGLDYNGLCRNLDEIYQLSMP